MSARLMLALVLCLPISRSFADSTTSTIDLMNAPGLSAFQPTSRWSRVMEATAVEGKKEITVSGEGPLLVNGLVKDITIPYLHTRRSFGDVKVELEFMIPKDSNAGVYLMGRYEIQIFDSYGKDRVGSADLGGLYARWDKTKPKEQQWTEGTAPKANASKAPGSWQTMEIVFHAPRFDAQGNKIRNATFETVRINGILVQENASTTGPTASAPLSGEAAAGPIVIQGDHGPIAIRRLTATPLPSPDAEVLASIDAFWAKVSKAVNQGDFESYLTTCHPDAVIVAGNKQACYPLQQALQRWKSDFEQTRSGEVGSAVDFRFSRRYRDATTAHESGIFRYTATPKGGSPVVTYTTFEALLVRKDGEWKMLMESQQAPSDEAAWNTLAE